MYRILLKVLKYLGYLVLSFALIVLSYGSMAFIVSAITVNEQAKDTGEEVEIFLLSNGVHADVVVPVKNEYMDWSKKIKFEHTRSGDTLLSYLGFGWGDKGFYLHTPQWSDLKFSTAFKALFYLGTSAMHTTFYKQVKEGEQCRKIKISKEEYLQLITYIRASFKEDDNANVMQLKGYSYGKYDAFYEAHGVYSLFYTCNTWTNNALKHCGQRACLWTPFDHTILRKYE
jgi:uncharacterized protein (TIGR02117 family)